MLRILPVEHDRPSEEYEIDAQGWRIKSSERDFPPPIPLDPSVWFPSDEEVEARRDALVCLNCGTDAQRSSDVFMYDDLGSLYCPACWNLRHASPPSVGEWFHHEQEAEVKRAVVDEYRLQAVRKERVIPASPSKPIEEQFWEAWLLLDLQQTSYRLVRQHTLTGLSKKFRLDFAHLATRTGIELDGFASHSSTDDIASDRRRQREIEAINWHVIRFGGKEVFSNPHRCAAEVYTALWRRTQCYPV